MKVDERREKKKDKKEGESSKVVYFSLKQMDVFVVYQIF